MTQVQAATEAERQLATWPTAPTPVQRRHLAMLFLAAGDFGSAMVQWLRLPEAERRAADGLEAEALKFLTRASGRMNESYDVAAVVAARVGLERLYAIDDHTSDTIDLSADPDFGPWQQARYERITASALGHRREADEAAVHDGATLLAYYVGMNAPHGQDDGIEADFGGAIADTHPKHFGRQYAAWWERATCAWPPISAKPSPPIPACACSTSSARRTSRGSTNGHDRWVTWTWYLPLACWDARTWSELRPMVPIRLDYPVPAFHPARTTCERLY